MSWCGAVGQSGTPKQLRQCGWAELPLSNSRLSHFCRRMGNRRLRTNYQLYVFATIPTLIEVLPDRHDLRHAPQGSRPLEGTELIEYSFDYKFIWALYCLKSVFGGFRRSRGSLMKTNLVWSNSYILFPKKSQFCTGSTKILFISSLI